MILITGAAGAIGKATVQQFLDADYHVLGIDRDASITDLFQTPEFIGLQIDVTDEYGLHKAVQYAADHGGLKHVVQIAGGALPREPVTQNDPLLIDVDLFRASLDENLTSQFIVLRAALPLLRATRYGDRSITLTSSINALAAMGIPAYSAAKAGLIGMMHALAAPLGREGIRINVVAPGTIVTPRTARIWAHDEHHFEDLAATTLLGRLGTPRDAAHANFAIATELTHVTGQVLVVDGGQLISHSVFNSEAARI